MDDTGPLTAYVTHWFGRPAGEVADAVEELVCRTLTVTVPGGRLRLEPAVVRHVGSGWAPVIEVRGRLHAGLHRWQVSLEVLPFSAASSELGLRPRRARVGDERWLGSAAAALQAVAAILHVGLAPVGGRRAGALPPAPVRRPA